MNVAYKHTSTGIPFRAWGDTDVHGAALSCAAWHGKVWSRSSPVMRLWAVGRYAGTHRGTWVYVTVRRGNPPTWFLPAWFALSGQKPASVAAECKCVHNAHRNMIVVACRGGSSGASS